MPNSLSLSRFLGGILLIAGCCIGAGMLGLPVLSAMAGFQPSLVIFLICWLFMVSTGLLLLEVNLWFDGTVNVITMVDKTLGRKGKAVAWSMFLFLFYLFMVAYIAASGTLVADFSKEYLFFDLSTSLGSLVFCLCVSYLLYLGTGAVDMINRFLMLGLIISYLCLVVIGLPSVNLELLQHADWSFASAVIPVGIVSFGFHNLVPSLTHYFQKDAKALKLALIIGSAIPFIIYILWEGLILGIVPLYYFQQALTQGDIATEALKDAVGFSWVVNIAQAFAFFAITTSFLSVALSFIDFLADGLAIEKNRRGLVILLTLALVPPFICALLYPTIFLTALNVAGGFCAVILFGLLPVLMVWKGRYIQHYPFPQLVPGGKYTLVILALFALYVLSLQLI